MKYIITESRLDELIYEYLDENYTPDTGWLAPVHYKRYVDRSGSYEFIVDDKVAFALVGKSKNKVLFPIPNTLLLWEHTETNLTNLFGELWKPVMVRWFEYNTGLRVKQLSTGLD